ncbi:MAG: hypothetical protein R8M70_03765 [Alphaproteobacteria bacterium]|nr:hypothetical protein [Alphaproteobacteria bacterium]
MKKTTAIASFLFLATLTGIVQAAPQIATRAYVDSKTVQAGTDISVTDGRTVKATYASLQYDLNDYVSNLQDKPLPINGISQANGLIKVTTGAWGQVAPDEAAPASGGDVYEAIQNAIQNLGYTAGAGISITDGVIAAVGDPNKNIKVYTDGGIGIAMDAFTSNEQLASGINRVKTITQNEIGKIDVVTDKWNEFWDLTEAPINTGKIKYELNRKTNNVTAGRLISVTLQDNTGAGTSTILGEKNYEIKSTLYPGNGIVFTDCLTEERGSTCIALNTSSNSGIRFNEAGELSLSGLSYNSAETDARLENGTSRIASITQTDGIISVTTGDWVTSLDAENLTEENAGVPATAKAIVAAIDQSVDPVEQTANNALQAANNALRVANNALQVANNAIPKPDPNECGAPGKRCVLTYGKNSDGVLTYEWEVVTRAEGEQ